jgi:CBS domain-containing protein
MAIVARDVMQADVKTVDPDLTLAELEQLLISEKVSGVPVVGEGRLAGIVSRTDIVRALSQEHGRAESLVSYYVEQGAMEISELEYLARETQMVAERMAKLRVRDAMTETLITVAPDASVSDVARTMEEHGIHRVLVAEDRTLLGIVSSLDLVRLISRGQLQPASA